MGIAIGHRRTGLCPTFAQPTLQRDGFLLRVPLVGGLVLLDQVECLAAVAGQSTNGIVELTNRGNLQLRGLARNAVDAALRACRDVDLGDYSASLVTISPFAGVIEHRLRDTLVRALADLDPARLSPKFVVHVDDAERTTADRSADLALWRTAGGDCQVTVRALGTSTCESAEEAAALARRLAEYCIRRGPRVRAADLVASEGSTALYVALGAMRAWLPARAVRRWQPLQVGITEQHLVVAAARFGRLSGATLAGVGRLLRVHQLASLRVTPWRTLAFTCTSPAQAASVLAESSSLGLLTDVSDPAVGVIACIGSAGCWQTELDTLGEAERFVASRTADFRPGALVHVSGCDKFCATRAPVTLTLVGRSDNSGFDTLGPIRQ